MLSPEEEGAFAQVQAGEDQARSDRTMEVAGSLGGAEEPIPPEAIEYAVRAVNSALDVLSDGKIRPIDVQTPDGPVDDVPPQLATALAGFAEVLTKAGLPAEQLFDPAAAVKTGGALQEAAAKLLAVARTPGIRQALRAKADGGKPAEEAPPAKQKPGHRAAAFARESGNQEMEPPTEGRPKAPPPKKGKERQSARYPGGAE